MAQNILLLPSAQCYEMLLIVVIKRWLPGMYNNTDCATVPYMCICVIRGTALGRTCPHPWSAHEGPAVCVCVCVGVCVCARCAPWVLATLTFTKLRVSLRGLFVWEWAQSLMLISDGGINRGTKRSIPPAALACFCAL